jgi:hypothetical protein
MFNFSDNGPLSAYLSGAVMATAAAIGLFFYRFWTRTEDRLFRAFAWAFWLMAVERLLLFGLGAESENRSYLYLCRLTAFLLIIKAIYDKNRPEAAEG